MKQLILLFSLVSMIACSSRKTANSIPTITDTTLGSAHAPAKAGNKPDSLSKLPPCIKKLIAEFSAEEKQNPPRKIISYHYNGSTVYYVPAICCDNYSDLYDTACNLIGHPDGGFTGRGDGKIVGFKDDAYGSKVVWADKRP